jgi:hypothetical protein
MVQGTMANFLCELYFKVNSQVSPIGAVGYYFREMLRSGSVTLREEHTLMMFLNRVLRRIFGPKREEVVGGWRLRNEEFHNLYACDLVKEDEMDGSCSMHG